MIENEFELLIGGDFYLEENYIKPEIFSKEIISLFQKSNFNIVNLESPITEVGNNLALSKTGPHLKASPKTLFPALKQLDINLLTLANNHIKDYGNVGLKETFENCKNQSFQYVGAGMNLKEAQKPFVIEVHKKKNCNT